ncbi:MAG: hypothetical protein PHW63_00380 [Alphaproteobacteria bacterium]|nr:hypothetical protein [Alphaproteobacteria bacterium]
MSLERVMVDVRGKRLPPNVFIKLIKWGAIIEEIRSFSSYFGLDDKVLLDPQIEGQTTNFNDWLFEKVIRLLKIVVTFSENNSLHEGVFDYVVAKYISAE